MDILAHPMALGILGPKITSLITQNPHRGLCVSQISLAPKKILDLLKAFSRRRGRKWTLSNVPVVDAERTVLSETWLKMGVSENRETHGYPQIINFHTVFHEINHPAIGIYPWLWETPIWNWSTSSWEKIVKVTRCDLHFVSMWGPPCERYLSW